MSEKASKLRSVFRKDGLSVAFKKTFKYIKTSAKSRFRLAYKSDFGKNRTKYEEMIGDALKGEYDRIFVWRSSFGWNASLFQRPQHISSSFSNKRCLVFYEVTQMTDEVNAIEKISDNLYLVNFQNVYINDLLLSALDTAVAPKYLQFYSTDWTLGADEVRKYINKGYKVLYEYIDEISPDLSGTKDLPANIKEKYELAMNDADNVYVVATAEILKEDVLRRRGDRNFVFSTNGVDYEFFKDLSCEPELDAEFEDIINDGKITVGYYGAMARWLDYEIIDKAVSTGKYSFVLIGVRYDDSLDSSGILELDDVHFLGQIDYKVLKYYASKLDILTIPFEINVITSATSPLKLFEYMALGKPIVTTAMNECMKYSSPLIAHSKDEFVSLLDKAAELRGDPEYMKLLDREARENSWDGKTDEILRMITNAENADK
ncbi:MAG: glycosyltransferase [Clostridia bacterium]|nr:glycosyltransferase [Clostridia bacterium]